MKATAPGPGGRSFEIDDELLTPHRRELAGGEHPPVRLVFAAAHVVMKESYRRPAQGDELAGHIDWQTTMALRTHLDAQGFGIAEAMDTAQRFALGWPVAKRLIEECGSLGPRNGFVAGAGVDDTSAARSAAEVVDRVVEQARFIQDSGGIVMLLPILWLPQNRSAPATYVKVYRDIIEQLPGPLFVHWLGDMFLPGLKGYFPADSFQRVMAIDPEKVRGCKLSLLDEAMEVRVRRELLARDQIVLTGDDLHFAGLIRGGAPDQPGEAERTTAIADKTVLLGDFSHGLLGVFDAVADPAGLALQFLARGNPERYERIMEPCEELGRWLFREPTRHYKAGLAFLAWLNGLQDNFMLVDREERGRSVEHLLRAAELAAAAGALRSAALAADRLGELVRPR